MFTYLPGKEKKISYRISSDNIGFFIIKGRLTFGTEKWNYHERHLKCIYIFESGCNYMNSSILVIPIVFIRYIIIRIINKEALGRIGFFPPTEGKEQIAFYIYQITTLFLLIYLFFTEIKLTTILNYMGLVIFLIGMLLYLKSIIDFSKPQKNGINKNGLYKWSRNPMYVTFFLYFLGCSLLIDSWVYFTILIVFQISVHFLILSEERWCIKEFGEEYRKYKGKVRRYI